MIEEHTEAVKAYIERNTYLEQFAEEVSPMVFYRDLFPEGSFEREAHQEDCKPNGIIRDIMGDRKVRTRILTDDLAEIKKLEDYTFALISPISFYGKRPRGVNASFCYAIAIDLDFVEKKQLMNLLHQMNIEYLPPATYVVNSGHGVHLYYFLEDPVPMYPNVQKTLKKLKHGLINRIWNEDTSLRPDAVQYAGIMQGFRAVGSPSKLGKEYLVKAFSFTGRRLSLLELNGYLGVLWKLEEKELTGLKRTTSCTLKEAKEKWPDWYQRRIVDGEKTGRWVVKRDLYDWWKTRIKSEIVVGHRFYGIFTLAIYAIKCQIPEEELREDAYDLLKIYAAMPATPDNPFTEEDVEAALMLYQESYVRFPRDDIKKLSGLEMPINKRNKRTQEQHVKVMRAVRDALYPDGEWRNKEGRPKGSGEKKDVVKEYLRENPEAKKAEVARKTGLSRTTVVKWYSIAQEELKNEKYKSSFNYTG